MNTEKMSAKQISKWIFNGICIVLLAIVFFMRLFNLVDNYHSIVSWWEGLIFIYSYVWFYWFFGVLAAVLPKVAGLIIHCFMIPVGIFIFLCEAFLCVGFVVTLNPSGTDGEYGIMLGATLLTILASVFGIVGKCLSLKD